MNTLLRMRRRISMDLQTTPVVEYHPEELDEYAPLKPEEADDVQLAEFFEDHDFSFLFVPPAPGARENDRKVVKRKLPQERTLLKHHRIPPTEEFDNASLLHKNKKRSIPRKNCSHFINPSKRKSASCVMLLLLNPGRNRGQCFSVSIRFFNLIIATGSSPEVGSSRMITGLSNIND